MKFPIGLTMSLSAYLFKQKLKGRKKFPLVLMIEPTHACNLFCDGCGRIRTWEEGQRAVLNADECLQSIEEADTPVVSICGGEPLMHPQIDEIVRRTLALKKYIYLCTNGMLITRFIERVGPDKRLILNVHFDGTEEFHDEVVKKKGCYARAFEGAVEAKKRGYQVCTNTTVFRQTKVEMLEEMYEQLKAVGVDGFLISPAYSYAAVTEKEHFMSREEIREKFGNGLGSKLLDKYNFWNSPIYVDYLQGKRELECTPWGNPTRDPYGWKKPCYLMEDGHADTFQELMEETEWSKYGPGNDPRCKDCLVHCGFEPTAVVETQRNIKDGLRMFKWNLS